MIEINVDPTYYIPELEAQLARACPSCAVLRREVAMLGAAYRGLEERLQSLQADPSPSHPDR